MNYAEAVAWLYGTQLSGIKLGLENMRRLVAALDLDFRGQKFLHVAGTNGKGSVCAMLDAICRAAGHRTALFTSPHLVSFRERARLNGAPIPEAAVASGLTRLRDTTSAWETPPTFFELTTALALDWFARERAEIVVLETGLGGRLDATNVFAAPALAACVLTSIDIDHAAWLGDTLPLIAAEKAGILKAGVPAVSAPQLPEARATLVRVATERGAPLRFVTKPAPAELGVNLAGSHQRLNAALALAALTDAGIPVSPEAMRSGLASVEWPGRFQRLDNGRIILDGAHNPAAARRLVQTWREEYGVEACATIVLGVLRDKDAANIVRALSPIAARFILTQTRTSPRASSAAELAKILVGVVPHAACEQAENFDRALSLARAHRNERILVTGSLFLVGEALVQLDPKAGGGLPERSAQ